MQALRMRQRSAPLDALPEWRNLAVDEDEIAFSASHASHRRGRSDAAEAFSEMSEITRTRSRE